jgi:16S rRNA (guanine966-N2)-methyltransferase
MRIVGGRWRGRPLAQVGRGDAAARLRPTSDRARESLFNVLAAKGHPADGAHVLDLFAGTGALALEALSRGAASAVLVDDGRAAAALIRRNVARLEATAQLLAVDATRLPPNQGPPAGLVFLDPPYGRDLGAAALTRAEAGGWLAPGALVVWEEDAAQAPPPRFVPHDVRRWGAATVTFLTAPGCGGDGQ